MFLNIRYTIYPNKPEVTCSYNIVELLTIYVFNLYVDCGIWLVNGYNL